MFGGLDVDLQGLNQSIEQERKKPAVETVPTLAIDAVSPAAVTIWEKEVGAEPDWIKSALRHSWVKVTVIA